MTRTNQNELADHLGTCAANYQQLMRLLPKERSVGQWTEWRFAESGYVAAFVSRREGDTEWVRLQQVWFKSTPWLPEWVLSLALYHDASMAEVIAVAKPDAVVDIAEPPPQNQRLVTLDDKLQTNQLLFEWLILCRHTAPV